MGDKSSQVLWLAPRLLDCTLTLQRGTRDLQALPGQELVKAISTVDSIYKPASAKGFPFLGLL